jgi:TolB-like protein/DNA-binding winged helix-turn-helix (wHTH) protein
LDVREPIRFGVFQVDLASGELRKGGVRIKLQEQPFQVLAALLERPHEVVTREDLQRRLWPSDVVVDFDRGLNKAINRVREALSDDADNPRFIETVPQRGYRFLAEIDIAPIAPPKVPEAGLHALMPRRAWIAAAGGLVAAPLLALAYRRLFSPEPRIESIAVLPLENLSGNIEQEYFSDGMTDELIGEISRISSLRVISRTSIMPYKGVRRALPEIARELNVDAILEGTVVQSGAKVRITAQLIRARDDRHLWAEKYERDLADVLAVQSEVAGAVASQIQTRLTPSPAAAPANSRSVNPAAYDVFLQGNFFLQRGIRGVGKSIALFKRAIELDPGQAESYAGLGEALIYEGIFGFRPSAETHAEARVAALKALELDESSAGAHNVLADVKKGLDWDLTGAEVEYKRALELNPSHLLSRLWYGECLIRAGREGQALEEMRKALQLDPVSPLSHSGHAMLLFRLRRYDEAIRISQHALELDPSFVNALWWQGLSYAGNRDFPKSIACLLKGIGMSEGPLFPALLGHVYGRSGERSKALGIVNQLTAMATKRFVSPVDFAIIHAGLGDANSTFAWLEKAYQARATRIQELPSMYFDSVRSDPRYADLLRRVGLPA